MRVGLALRNFVGPTETPDIDALYRYAERAEALGFESLWAWDHVILGVDPSFPILDAVGTLDIVSKGRLILGVAAGWYAREFDAVGVPFKQRGRLFERNLEILTRLWTEERVTLRADEFNLREAVMRPQTVQRPRPPILIGGYVDAVLKRVATKGDGWLTYFYTPDSYARSWQKILGYAREAGRDPRTLSGTNQLAILVGPSRAETEEPMRRWLSTEWDVAAWSESTIEHAIRGNVKECIEQLRAHVASGVDRLILIPYRYEPAQVEIIAREILPALR